MNKKLTIAIATTAVLTAIVTFAAARNHYYEAAEDLPVPIRVLDSRVLGEKRELLIHLPESYERDASRRYPVLYVLDGSSQAGHTAEAARLLARIGVAPELIVIGIPSSDENRRRDYTPPYMQNEDENGAMGKADAFLTFLRTELIPYVDRSCRTTPTRMLAGNSRGGLFVVYSLIEAPDLFDARFAFSPALHRDGDRIVSELAKSPRSPASKSAFLYLSLGDRENEKMTRAFRKTATLLGNRARADFTAGATHQSNAKLSTPVALHEFFRQQVSYPESR